MKNSTFWKCGQDIICVLLILCSISSYGQNITAIEYFFDVDPGYNNGTVVSINPTSDASNVQLSINTSSLASGMHQLFIRSLDEEGHWSLTQKQSLQIDQGPPLSLIDRIEYYLNTDPGVGNGIPLSVTAANPIDNLNALINASGVPNGLHTLCVRSQDQNGQWSTTNCQPFFKSDGSALLDITALEYYFDSDPGFGSANPLSVSSATDISNLIRTISTSGLNEGPHQLCVRAKNSNGLWSNTHCKQVFKTDALGILNITALEYYFDTDPGFGNGNSILITASSDIMNATNTLNTSGLQVGPHTLFLRAKDESGKWSFSHFKTVYIQDISLHNLTKLEYFVDNDPGLGQANAINITPGLDKANVMVTLSPNLSNGMHQIGFRSADINNNWSLTTHQLILKHSVYLNNKVDTAEYFIDNDPGLGNGTPLNIPDGQTLESLVFGIEAAGLNDGMHHLYIRVKDSINHWSLSNVYSFMKTSPSGENIVKGEYFIDTDPGLDNGIPFTVNSGSDINVLGSIDVSGLSQGMHVLYSRLQNDSMAWAHTQVDRFMLKEETIVPIDGGEYFFDTEPGLDNGIGFALPPNADLSNATIVVLADTLSLGLHDLYIRTHTQDNEWSHTNIVLNIDRNAALPVDWLAFDVYKQGEDAHLEWSIANAINASHFEVARLTSNSREFEPIGRLDIENDLFDYSYVDEKPGKGTVYYRIKQIDFDGQFDFSPTRSVGFESDVEWSVYPNPTVSSVTIEGVSNRADIQLYNSQNQLLETIIASRDDKKLTLDFDQLIAGPYFILIQEDSVVKTIMVIKQ